MINHILFILLCFYIFAFILLICQALYNRIKINTLVKQAKQMINELDVLNTSGAEEIAIRNNVNKEHIKYFITSYGYQLSTNVLDSKFYLWQKKVWKYAPYITWGDSIPNRIKSFSSFINRADSYKYDYNFLHTISKTILFPSLLLAYIGIPVNWFSRLVNIVLGLMALYGFYEKFVLPILQSKGLL